MLVTGTARATGRTGQGWGDNITVQNNNNNNNSGNNNEAVLSHAFILA